MLLLSGFVCVSGLYCTPILGRGPIGSYSRNLPSRSELAITLTELKLMAALAIMGFTNPKAAKGMLNAL